MCCRYSLHHLRHALLAGWPAAACADIRPGDTAWVGVALQGAAGEHALAAEPLRWGLMLAGRETLLHARAESAAQKPLFRAALDHGRCAVPATAWYEWRKLPGGKQPYVFRRADGGLVFMAGLRVVPPQGGARQLVIVTCAAHAAFAAIHPRMPLVLEEAHLPDWLDGKARAAELGELLGMRLRAELTAEATQLCPERGGETLPLFE